MDDHIHEGSFYEDDEPVEDIVAAWDGSGEQGLTGVFYRLVVPVPTCGGSETIVRSAFAPPMGITHGAVAAQVGVATVS